ncbi:phospholipid/cholesterol/gamma-HCH transport system substrate-binding protein [Aquiflexum balticum DSM 16537]|uniref:Phospholipid/cholesterol/gamma-HCH transport system substrate-binding protein n=1 Tax=Aquiflexum balticum DSM 16537 TaxID=758820 RepID=A0A1W2H9A5_9BACT|nr:MlaD family protein [Aquiflexum balticum]SMD45449.1 phospholipid/cholesterol/gamma-HCH transport system substrate-binding protein [Aquiflexum balticum DSM 16537]
MRTKKTIDNAKLGGLVVAGILFLVFTLYMIGKNQNIFGASITITAVVENVNGLVPGNNVRFKGLNVGTVKSVDMANDSSLHVVMYIQKKMVPYIKKNALTSIGTDGLMGNKLIQIIPQDGFAENVAEGDVIYSITPVSTEAMLQRLGTSSEYFEKTTENLYEITTKLNQSESLWALLSDSLLTGDIKEAVSELKLASRRASEMARAGNQLMVNLKDGEGLVQKLFTDAEVAEEFTVSLEKIRESSDQASKIMGDVKILIENLEEGEGTAGLILKDSTFREALLNSMLNVEKSTERFNENMLAMRSNFLFRGYFKKLEKEKQKELKQKE